MEGDQYMLADSINQKLDEYWRILDDATTIATILDPRNKIALFELGEPITKAINTLKEIFSLYYSREPRSQPSVPKENKASGREYFRQLKKRRLGETTETLQASSPSNNPDFAEIERYLALPCDENVEVLLWWQAHSAEFPVLSLMARDYLAIQSTSVACEQGKFITDNWDMENNRNYLLINFSYFEISIFRCWKYDHENSKSTATRNCEGIIMR